MPGLLDGFMDDPSTMGLLGMAGGLLSAGGPSLMPHTLGQGLAAGFDGMNKAYNSTMQTQLDRQKEALQMNMLKQQVEQATRKNGLINDFLQQNMGGGSQATPAMSSTPMGAAGMPANSMPMQPGNAPIGTNSSAGFGGIPSAAIAADLAFNGGTKMGEWINDRSKPTDFTKLLQQAGIDPNSTLGRQMMQQHIAKQNNIPLVSGRAGAPMYNPDGTIAAMAPIIPKNAVPTIENGRVTGVSPLAGAANVEQINAYADQAGKNQAEPIAGFSPDGKSVYTNKFAAANGGASGGTWSGGSLDSATLAKLNQAAAGGNKDALAALTAYAGRGQAVTPSLQPGVDKSIGGNIETMNNDFADLYAQNKAAPTSLAVLDNIKKLAPKAIMGSQAERLAFLNGLLTLGGMSGTATDLKTATDLFDKNSNMLVANMRKSAGGAGTDAFQALAQASNPNNHMTPAAAIEAADTLIGQIKMAQKQYKTMLPFKMNNDAVGYYNAQQQFVNGADPRNYQPDAGHAPSAPAAPNKFDMLPPAAQYEGKRLQADNGTIYRAVGGKWVKE